MIPRPTLDSRALLLFTGARLKEWHLEGGNRATRYGLTEKKRSTYLLTTYWARPSKFSKKRENNQPWDRGCPRPAARPGNTFCLDGNLSSWEAKAPFYDVCRIKLNWMKHIKLNFFKSIESDIFINCSLFRMMLKFFVLSVVTIIAVKVSVFFFYHYSIIFISVILYILKKRGKITKK